VTAPVRWRSPDVRAVELWDAWLDGRTLWDAQREDPGRLPELLGRLLPALVRGEAAFEDGRVEPPLGEVGHVHAMGGLVSRWPPLSFLRCGDARVPLTVDPDPFAAAAAGEAVAPDALVADVGQTAVKVTFRGRRWRHVRDFAALPIASELGPDEWARRRGAVIDFVAAAIREAAAPARPPALVLALPCALDDRLTASGCSYPYPKPDPALVRDLVLASDLGGVPTFVLNDAELAAVAAARHLNRNPRTGSEPPAMQVPRARPTLVLTCGFGVGAALLRARS
jgi:hypothetical protein